MCLRKLSEAVYSHSSLQASSRVGMRLSPCSGRSSARLFGSPGVEAGGIHPACPDHVGDLLGSPALRFFCPVGARYTCPDLVGIVPSLRLSPKMSSSVPREAGRNEVGKRRE